MNRARPIRSGGSSRRLTLVLTYRAAIPTADSFTDRRRLRRPVPPRGCRARPAAHRIGAPLDGSAGNVRSYRRCAMARRFAVLLAVVLVLVPFAARALETAKPEDVGLSAERLARIGQALSRQTEDRHFPGAVALVIRKGRIAYFGTTGQLGPN